MKGSITVEASFVFPLCFAVTGVVFYLGIFQYNQAVLKMTGYECILRNVEEISENEEYFKEAVIKDAKDTAAERTLGIKDLTVSVKVTPTKILLIYQCTQQLIFETSLETAVTYEQIYPELTLRLGRGRRAK